MKRDPLQYEIHPLADLLPRLGGAEFDALRDDINTNGLQQPIVLHENMILDGRHRYQACCELGIHADMVDLGDRDPVAFVLSANVHRRHLTPGQQGMVTALVLQYRDSQPKVSGKIADCPPDDKPAVKMKQVAEAAGISERTLRDSKKVAAADPELAKEVVAGTVSLPAAVEQVTGKRPGTKDTGNLAARVAELEAQVKQLTAERDQLAEDNRELLAEAEAMGKIIDADDKLKAASAEIKKLQGTVAKLEQRIAGLQNEKNAAVRAAKSAQRKK